MIDDMMFLSYLGSGKNQIKKKIAVIKNQIYPIIKLYIDFIDYGLIRKHF